MKTTLFTILFVSVCLFVQAQVPGYAGKKLGISLDLGLSPALNKYMTSTFEEMEAAGYSSDLPKVGVNMIPGVNMEYVLSKSIALGVDYTYFNKRSTIHYFFREDNETYHTYGYAGETKLSAGMPGFYFKYYPFRKKGSIAPIGKYHELAFFIGNIKVKTGDLVVNAFDAQYFMYIIQDPDISVTDFEELNYDPVRTCFIKYAFGSEKIVFKNFTTDVNVQVVLPFNYFVNMKDDADHLLNYTDGYQYYRNDIQEAALNTLFFNLNIGFGSILF